MYVPAGLGAVGSGAGLTLKSVDNNDKRFEVTVTTPQETTERFHIMVDGYSDAESPE